MGKRMAVCAKRLKKSKKYPKYWKYTIDVEEVDGSISTIPAYGVDLEDALSSVELIEKRSWLVRLFNKTPQWLLLIIGGIIMGGAAILSEYYSTPTWIIGLLGVIAIIGVGLYHLNSRIEKHMIDNNE